MNFANFTLRTIKVNEDNLCQAIFTSPQGNIRGWGLSQKQAIIDGKLSILKHTAMRSQYPIIIYQPDINFILFVNDKADSLFESAYEIFDKLSVEDKKILETVQEFEFTVDDQVFNCLATDYQVGAKIRYFQFQCLPKEDLSYPHNFENNQGVV